LAFALWFLLPPLKQSGTDSPRGNEALERFRDIYFDGPVEIDESFAFLEEVKGLFIPAKTDKDVIEVALVFLGDLYDLKSLIAKLISHKAPMDCDCKFGEGDFLRDVHILQEKVVPEFREIEVGIHEVDLILLTAEVRSAAFRAPCPPSSNIIN
jgi:hypothetical protein